MSPESASLSLMRLSFVWPEYEVGSSVSWWVSTQGPVDCPILLQVLI